MNHTASASEPIESVAAAPQVEGFKVLPIETKRLTAKVCSKRRVSAYTLFYEHERQLAMNNLSSDERIKFLSSRKKKGSFSEMASAIAAKWKNLPEEERAYYENLVNKGKDRKARVNAAGALQSSSFIKKAATPLAAPSSSATYVSDYSISSNDHDSQTEVTSHRKLSLMERSSTAASFRRRFIASQQSFLQQHAQGVQCDLFDSCPPPACVETSFSSCYNSGDFSSSSSSLSTLGDSTPSRRWSSSAPRTASLLTRTPAAIEFSPRSLEPRRFPEQGFAPKILSSTGGELQNEHSCRSMLQEQQLLDALASNMGVECRQQFIDMFTQ